MGGNRWTRLAQRCDQLPLSDRPPQAGRIRQATRMVTMNSPAMTSPGMMPAR